MKLIILPLLIISIFAQTPIAEGSDSAPENLTKSWTSNEVSILYPLPGQGEKSVAIPLSLFIDKKTFKKQFDSISPGKGVGGDNFDSTYLIAIRIDPCFRDQFAEKCKPQIRGVWQILDFSGPKTVALDAAIHTFHSTDLQTLMAFLSQLKELNKPYESMFAQNPNLGVNPVLSHEGLRSSYASGLRNLLLSTLFKFRVTRIAALRLQGFQSAWDFFSFDVDSAGKFTPVAIAGSSQREIRFDNVFQNPKEMIAAMKQMGQNPQTLELTNGKTVTPEELYKLTGFLRLLKGKEYDIPKTVTNKYLQDSNRFTQADIPKLKNEIQNINNPLKHLPGTVDCLSCHGATPVKNYLEGKTGAGVKSLHAFGYFGAEPSISNRVRLETEAVVEALNKL